MVFRGQSLKYSVKWLYCLHVFLLLLWRRALLFDQNSLQVQNAFYHGHHMYFCLIFPQRLLQLYLVKAICLHGDVLMLLATIWSRLWLYCILNSMFRSVPPLFILTRHDANVAAYMQVCSPFCILKSADNWKPQASSCKWTIR